MGRTCLHPDGVVAIEHMADEVRKVLQTSFLGVRVDVLRVEEERGEKAPARLLPGAVCFDGAAWGARASAQPSRTLAGAEAAPRMVPLCMLEEHRDAERPAATARAR